MLDPRLAELIKYLEHLIEELPEIPWPPEPDPGPLLERVFFKEGALDEVTLNAARGLTALKSLPPVEVPLYIEERPYLKRLCSWCSCTEPVKVAQGFIRPDGRFLITWREQVRIMMLNCHDEYAYKVKQNIDGSIVTIYNGVDSGNWYEYGEEAVLRSYHPEAQGCRHNDFPETGTFALLQDIGFTESYHLKTPDANGWHSVAAPAAYNDGLCYPAPSAQAAKGKWLDRNWGGVMKLRYHFSEELKGIGAMYYRVSVARADLNGNPIGGRTNLNTPSWKYYKMEGNTPCIGRESLGPHNEGGKIHLFVIPYDDNPNGWRWHSGQYHALLDTRRFGNGRFLVTLELFNKDGVLLRPNGTPDPGGSISKAFTFRRWNHPTGPTAEVPYAGLTHMFWWDNRKAVAVIKDFRVNGEPSKNQCQFRSGDADDSFSCGYRAYHPEPMFLLNHKLWWRRGMGIPASTGSLTIPHWSPENVGIPPAQVHESTTARIKDMLGSSSPGSACTFTMNLYVNVKTWNGVGTLNSLDAMDQGSFALEISH